VVVLDTSLEPDILLASCKQIEQALGRKPYPGYTDREIDIDILLYNDTVLASDELIIPHRALADRNFFLQPLSDVAQLIIEPRSGKTIKQLLDNCPDTLQVKLYEPN
jgi:2-amino-4-hydroxy-6-hydroxymethyldihydropteridine diphosphokinase